MPLKNGQFTPQELAFSEAYARTGDKAYASAKAGAKSPVETAAHMLRRPAVVARINALRAHHLPSLVEMAYQHFQAVLAPDSKASVKDKNAAGRIVLAEAGKAVDSEDGGKDLSEMDGAELAAALAASRARLAALEHTAAERARPVIEGEIEAEESVFD